MFPREVSAIDPRTSTHPTAPPRAEPRGRLAIATSIALAVYAPPLASQTVIAAVFEAESQRPVRGALVVLVDSLGRSVAGTMVDDAGAALLRVPVPGRYGVIVRRIGYRLVETVDVDLAAGDHVEVDLPLVPLEIQLAPVTVTADAAVPRRLASFERRRAGRGIYLTEDEIKARRPILVTDVFSGMVGTRVVRLPGSAYTVRFPSRRFTTLTVPRYCEPELYIDDAYVGRADLWINMLVDADDLLAIEVYRNEHEVPAELLTNRSSCGTIVLWTRRPGRSSQ